MDKETNDIANNYLDSGDYGMTNDFDAQQTAKEYIKKTVENSLLDQDYNFQYFKDSNFGDDDISSINNEIGNILGEI